MKTDQLLLRLFWEDRGATSKIRESEEKNVLGFRLVTLNAAILDTAAAVTWAASQLVCDGQADQGPSLLPARLHPACWAPPGLG